MQIDSRVLGFIGAGVSMLINSWLQGLLSFAHVSLITVISGTHNTIHKVWAFFFGLFVFDVDYYHMTKTAGQLPDDVRWYRMKRCSKNVSSSNRFTPFYSFLLQLDDWEHSFLCFNEMVETRNLRPQKKVLSHELLSKKVLCFFLFFSCPFFSFFVSFLLSSSFSSFFFFIENEQCEKWFFNRVFPASRPSSCNIFPGN